MSELTRDQLIGLRDKLILMRASGIRVSQYEGKRLEYRTDQEFDAAIRFLEKQIDARSVAARPRVGIAHFVRD